MSLSFSSSSATLGRFPSSNQKTVFRALRAGMLPGAEPPVLGEIDGDAVGPGEFDLDVAALLHVFRSRVGTVHGARLLDARARLRHVLHLDAEVVHAGVARRALGDSGVLALELQDGDVHMAVAQVIALGGRGVELADLLQAEALHIEPRRCLRIPGADRNVAYACHGRLRDEYRTMRNGCRRADRSRPA